MWMISLEHSLMAIVKKAPLKSRAGLWAYAWARLDLQCGYRLCWWSIWGRFLIVWWNIPLLPFPLLRSIVFEDCDDFENKEVHNEGENFVDGLDPGSRLISRVVSDEGKFLV
jgi:hypothetical protein